LQHHAASYSKKGYRRKLTIIRECFTTFSLQAGFPTGLVIKKFGTNEHTIGDLSGISVAFLGEVKFYDHHRINKVRPYGLGFGILALNILSFASDNTTPDIAPVGILSLTPFGRNNRFQFPLYFGGGYLLKSGHWFFLMGPGIQFNF